MAPWLWDVLALASVLIASFAVAAVQLLGGLYTDEPSPTCAAAFDSSPNAALALAVLTTTENFPEARQTPAQRNADLRPAPASIRLCSRLFPTLPRA